MSSGQQRVFFMNLERAISDDQITHQNFIARERNEILRVLLERDYSRFSQPGVSMRAEGTADAPLAGVVLDGIEMIVDSPGNVLVTAGTLAAWIGPPTNPLEDSGFVIIPDAGIDTLGKLTIADNTGTAPRCDVIECQPMLDSVVTHQNRDSYDEANDDFQPTSVAKFFRSQLVYRVRQGTPGTPPGYAEGWLPIGLAIVQPGAPANKIDYYDVRPLYRELGSALPVEGYPLHPSTGNDVQCVGASTISDTGTFGQAETEFNDQRYGGPVFENSPSPASALASFGTRDQSGFYPTARNFVRGIGISTVARDRLIVAAWIPDLGVAGRYLPRCVRYSQGIPTTPALPTRRRAWGPNGILLAVAASQDPVRFDAPLTLAAEGIAGCLGAAVGVPLFSLDVNPNNDGIESKSIGVAEGLRNVGGFLKVGNRVVSIGSHEADGFSGVSTVSSFAPIEGAAFTLDVRGGDEVELTIGPIKAQSSSAGGILRVAITEHPSEARTNRDFQLPDANWHYLTIPIHRTISATGTTLDVELQISGAASPLIEMYAGMAANGGVWAVHRVVRP